MKREMVSATTTDASIPADRNERAVLFALAALVPLVLWGIVLFHLSTVSQLNQDEFQHVHIAWQTLHGKLLYRDFYEHHGPLTAWLGALALRAKGAAAASFDTFDLFRTINLSGVSVLFGLVALLVRHIGGSWAAGLLATGFLASSHLFGWVGLQFRPDSLQNVLVLAALLLLVARRDAWAGLCLGLLPVVHPKALLAVAFVLVGVAATGLARLLRASDRGEALRREVKRWAWLAGGVVTLQAVVVAVFALQGGLGAYWKQAWVGNFSAVGRTASSAAVAASTREKLLMFDGPLTATLAAVMVLAAIGLWRSRRDAAFEDRLLVLGAAAASLLTLLLPFRAYALLLPMALAATTLGVGAPWRIGPVSPALLLAGLYACIVTPRAFGRLHAPPHPERPMQEMVVGRVLAAAPRDEPVFYVWPSRCAGYVFNEDPGYDWLNTTRAVFDVASPESDEHFDRAFRDNVMSGQVGYVALDSPYAEKLPAAFRAYLDAHFQVRGCLWERR